jgi:hypothetical protein
MTATTIPTTATTPSLSVIAISTAAVTVFWTAFGAHTWAEVLTMAALEVVAVLVVVALAIPRLLRRPSTGGPALAFSVAGVLLTVPAFWTGLPLLFGVAGAVLGNAGRTRDHGARASLAAVALGLLAVLGYLAIYIGDGLIAGNHGFLVEALG